MTTAGPVSWVLDAVAVLLAAAAVAAWATDVARRVRGTVVCGPTLAGRLSLGCTAAAFAAAAVALVVGLW